MSKQYCIGKITVVKLSGEFNPVYGSCAAKLSGVALLRSTVTARGGALACWTATEDVRGWLLDGVLGYSKGGK